VSTDSIIDLFLEISVINSARMTFMSQQRWMARYVAVAIISLASACVSSTETVSRDAETLTTGELLEGSPEDVGMSSDRLNRLSNSMQQLIDEGRLAGMTTMIARHGKIVHFETYGYRDIEAEDVMAKDTIFRIYSMSKPITGVALMMLYEEGKFNLSDPVEKYIPEFQGLRTALTDGPDGPILEDSVRPMTIRELMNHTAGLTYGSFSSSQVDTMYRDRKVLAFDGTLQDMIDRLAEIPLRQQPGTKWHYSVAVDVQGYLVEVLSGMSFDDFLAERLFEPLGMVDTAFYVPRDEAGRFAQLYSYADNGTLIPPAGFGETNLGVIARDEESVVTRYLEPPTFFSGGGGLVSTTSDYMRFCQMLLNGGEFEGLRYLSPLTVELMRQDHLPDGLDDPTPNDGIRLPPGTGFGLDFAVVNDPIAAETYSRGEYYWMGAAGTWFWIDPVEDLIFIGMIQQMGQGVPDVRSLSRRLTYQAILKSSKTQWF